MYSFRAKFYGTCSLCGDAIRPGHPIVRAAPLDGPTGEETHQHVWCAQHARARHRIASGQTFASRKPNTWRRR